jgi:hypothetical protein
MYRVILSFFLIASLVVIFGATLLAQDDANSASATCNFDEDKQLVVQYQHVAVNLKKPVNGQVPFGKVWAPGGKAMVLFTNTPIQIGSRTLPIGAYNLYVIPNRSNGRWLLPRAPTWALPTASRMTSYALQRKPANCPAPSRI